MKVYLATFEAEDGTEFTAVGNSLAGATEILIETMSKHAFEKGMAPDWWKLEDELGIVVRDVEIGTGFRDGMFYYRHDS